MRRFRSPFVLLIVLALADGSTKAIKDVKIGDRVVSATPHGASRAWPVTALRTSKGTKHLVEITIDTDDDRGSETGSVVATETHPFWVEDLNAWVPAGDLKPGMWLRTSAGSYVQISAVNAITRHHQRVHNLTVYGPHTYHVAAADGTNLLVHNVGCMGRQVNYGGDDLSRAAFDARTRAGFPDYKNVAVAKVEGRDELVYGFSKGDDWHAEIDIISQLKEGEKITAIFTERAPCGWGPNCAKQLAGVLAEGGDVTWAVPWARDSTIRKASNELLSGILRKLGG